MKIVGFRSSQLKSTADIFHALGRFIFKTSILAYSPEFMCYGTSGTSAMALLGIAPYCQCYNVLYDSRFFFDGMIYTLRKWGKTSDPGFRVPESWQDIWHFSRNLGEIKNRIESDVEEGYKRNKLKLK